MLCRPARLIDSDAVRDGLALVPPRELWDLPFETQIVSRALDPGRAAELPVRV